MSEPAERALRGVLSERALRYLAARGAVIDPALRGSEADLLARLGADAAALVPALLAVQRSVGGLTWREGEGWVFEVAPCVHAGPLLEFDGRAWIAVGGFWVVFYIDAAGAMLEADELGARMIVADSVVAHLEGLALEADAGARFGAAREVFESREGERIARERGAAPVPEASGAVRRWWVGPDVYIEEAHEPVEHLARERVWRTFVWR